MSTQSIPSQELLEFLFEAQSTMLVEESLKLAKQAAGVLRAEKKMSSSQLNGLLDIANDQTIQSIEVLKNKIKARSDKRWGSAVKDRIFSDITTLNGKVETRQTQILAQYNRLYPGPGASPGNLAGKLHLALVRKYLNAAVAYSKSE